jgi:pSer/pThr/pTyr-binding forkhead associated (FHA) protein/outer membrane biosynthesis protein TonB
MLKLSIQDSEGRSTIVPLTDGELSVGRDEANSICLADRNVSRQHARLTTKSGHVWLENVHATYGTRFNNLLLRERAELREGDVVQVGDYVLELVSEGGPAKRDNALVDAPASQAPPPPPRPAAAPAGRPRPVDENSTAVVNLLDIQDLLKSEPAGSVSSLPESSQPRLVVESDNLRGLELRITRSPVTVGRVRDACDLVVDHRSISKEHARFTRLTDGTWQVLDLASANGMKVNGEPYSKCEVRSGDLVELGHVSLRFLTAGARAPATSDKPRSSNLIIYLAVAALLVVGAAVAAFFAMKGDGGKTPPKSDVKVQAAATAETESPSAEPATRDAATEVRKAEKLHEAGMLAEARTVLKAAEADNPGNASIALLLRRIELELGQLADLDEAETLIETDPATALARIQGILAEAKPETPIADRAEKLLAKSKEAVAAAAKQEAKAAEAAPAEKAKPTAVKPAAAPAPAPKAVAKPTPAPTPKAVAPKPEPKPEPKVEPKPTPAPAPAPEPAAEPARKTGADFHKEGRDAILAGKPDEAISLFKQAVANGYFKAHGQLARIFFQRGDKANCAKHAKAYLDRYPDAGDAQPLQGMLEKCSN